VACTGCLICFYFPGVTHSDLIYCDVGALSLSSRVRVIFNFTIRTRIAAAHDNRIPDRISNAEPIAIRSYGIRLGSSTSERGQSFLKRIALEVRARRCRKNFRSERGNTVNASRYGNDVNIFGAGLISLFLPPSYPLLLFPSLPTSSRRVHRYAAAKAVSRIFGGKLARRLAAPQLPSFACEEGKGGRTRWRRKSREWVNK